MKKIIYILAILGFTLGACDKIDDPYLVERGGSGPEPDTTVKVRKLLLEEFTGHTCVNCPEATQLASDLKTIYGEQLILLSIHAGGLAVPGAAPYQTDYRTAAGTAIFNYFDPIGVPTGLVNRKAFQGDKVLFKDNWEPAIEDLIDLPPDVSIEIEAEYYNATRLLDMHVHSEILTSIDRSLNISVFIIESGMISAQKSVGEIPDILDYEHNHVLRTSLNGTWGELLAETPEIGMIVHKDFSINLDLAWTAENIAIIALVIDSETYEVIQAEEFGINNHR